MIIRTELPADYAQIAELHGCAFTQSRSQEESVLTAVLRQEKTYDPQLALVAEVNGEIIGHVMVVPYTFQVYGEFVNGGILAPLGVKPEWQRKGVGSRLIARVHENAVKADLSFILLLGHDTYYPRFGYVTKMFGEANIDISLPLQTGLSNEEPAARKPLPQDVQKLEELWQETHRDVPLCLKPEANFLSWISTNKAVDSLVFTAKKEVIGYARVHGGTKEIKSFLAKDAQAGKQMLRKLVQSYALQDSVSLPLHPLRKNWFSPPEKTSGKTASWAAAMICPLDGRSAVHSYISNVGKEADNTGIIHWPVPFELV
ncbi:Predicted N-acetyltransferase YhbS [Evansella caseinilytica]|uniref:Predicted N-acetyltransferase YhbS n=1 Tax=Evansella caseinilytica TaxID=1503961 RepID=A0A1H3RF30_9BACI|nr:GNAT family N-acetyltransferase [Evansella caseinilytica]SDZ24324.1 Predicted N-acetyltransferase YhbS [Evansella caseinilytica]